MAPQEQGPPLTAVDTPLDRIRATAPWLLEPELATCVVGSSALREACHRAGLEAPYTADLDLAWALDIERGEALLRDRGVFEQTTTANRGRGTLALRLDGERVEITSFRGAADRDTASSKARIEADLGRRDMTVGAIAWWLDADRLLDPFDGLEHWRQQRVAPVGNPEERVREHPIRWIRYYRKAHGWGFDLDRSIRKLDQDLSVLDSIPAEAIGAEIRAILSTNSPGSVLMELHEVGILPRIAPELAPQFDGRPAGPVRHHPEVSQALHMIMVLEWAVANTVDLDPNDAYAVKFAALCHDLGKNESPAETFPSHHGHERGGLPIIDALCQRLPGIASPAARDLAKRVSELHLNARHLREMRPGTLARLYETHLRQKTFRRDLFALAVAADSAGRRGRSAEGAQIRQRVLDDIDWLCTSCERVDAAELRAAHTDVQEFKQALHEARARSIAKSR